MSEAQTRVHRFVLSLGAAALACGLSGCGGSAGSVADGGDPGDKIGNLLAFRSLNAPPLTTGPVQQEIDCPVVQVDPGKQAVRVGGEGAASVRYQISIGKVARECAESNGQLLVRVGVETRTVIGAAGSPGTYTAPLTVSLRRIADEKVVTSRTYRVGGATGPDREAGLNSFVSDPLSAPFTTPHAADDYEIVLAFGGRIEGGERAARRHKR